MAGDPTSHFQDLNPILPPRVATTLSREQFLYSLARTPSPARFQRPRSNHQISPALNANLPPVRESALSSEQFIHSLSRNPAHFQRPHYNYQIHPGPANSFQTGGIKDGATRFSHYATSAKFNLIGGPNSEPPGKPPVTQNDENLDGANNRPDLIPNELVTNFQRLASEAKSRSTLRAAQIPTPTSERNTVKEPGKTAVGIIASEIYSIAPSSPPHMTSVASVELGECNTQFNLGDESGYDSNGSTGEESGSLYTDANITLSGSDESGLARAQSTGVSRLDFNAPTRKSPSTQQGGSSVIDESFGATGADRILPGPSKKKLKRPTRSDSKTLAQGVVLQAIRGEIVEETVPGQICRTFDQLQLTEEKAAGKGSSESGDVISDDGNSMIESQLITGDVLSDDDSSMIETQLIVPDTPLLSIRQKRFPESSPQKPRKKQRKAYPITKMVSSKIHFKDLTLINRVSVPPDCPKPILTRLDFCDGFVGEESQPIGCKKAKSRPRRLPRPGMLRLSKGYACSLPLVQSRTFGVEPSLQEEKKRNAPTPITFQPHQTGEVITMSGGRVVSNEEHNIPLKKMSNLNAGKGSHILSKPTVCQTKPADQMSGANPESIADYKASSIKEDVDMDVVFSPQSEECDNESSFSGSPLLDISPAKAIFKRRVTFNEDVEVIRQQVIRQQLAMVSAPLPISTTSSDDESDSDHMYEDDEDTHSEGSGSHASENGSEVSSSADEHSIEPSSPRHDRSPLSTTLPSTPIRRWDATEAEASDSPGGGEVETEMLDDEMILDDDTASVVSKRYQVSDTVRLWGKNFHDKRLNWSPSCPWAPRRPALARHSTEIDGDICASPSSRAPRDNTVNNIRLNQSQMYWDSTQPATPIPRYHREPSIELGNPDWPPRSFYSQSIMDSQASRVMDLSHQSQQFVVADIPSYFSAASQNFNQPVYKPTVPPMRSKSMPMRSQYFEKEQDWNAYENIFSNTVPARKIASYMGSQDERNTSLRVLTRHISMGFGTPGERRRNPLLPFRPPLKHI